MRIFFSLAPHFMKDAAYEASVRQMAKTFNFDPVFGHEIPNGADPADWIASKIAESQFAFFDLTGLSSDVIFALGIATQSEDATVQPMVDIVEHEKARGGAGPICTALLADAKRFNKADDFQRKAHMFVRDRVGSAIMRDGAFIARIKDGIKRRGPIQMRQLAEAVGKPMPEIQPIVYELVRTGEVTKINDKRWTQYSLT